MGHRGPDDYGISILDNICLHHLRLSIIDAEGGSQPMSYLSRYHIIFNGEIYNYKELNKEYDLPVKSNSDTETILHLFHKLGPDCLHTFDGMFALAIYDEQNKSIFLARDRAGKKPLYMYNFSNQIVFASELNCFKALLPLEIDTEYINEYLRLGSFYKSHTCYKYVEELEAGSWCTIDTQSLKVVKKKWWSIHDFYLKSNLNISEHDMLELTEVNLKKAVNRRIDASDLEVGSFLSGGIDSGLVTAIASQHSRKLKTFTVSFKGAYDEGPLAKLVSEKYQTEHTEINISFDNLERDIESIMGIYGEPFFDSSAIPSYYVSQEAKKHLTVILNGDGADELFGGYRRYVPFAKFDWFNTPNILGKTSEILLDFIPAAHEKKSLYNYAYRFLSLASASGLDTYFRATSDIFEGFTNQLCTSNELYDMNSSFNKINNSSLTGLQKLMNMDFDTLLFSDLLVKMDIATMTHSIEGRSPFLSKELLESVPSFPDNMKIQGSTTKYLLRKLATKYLPEPLINQPKRGFEIPLKKWVNDQLKHVIFDFLERPNAYSKNFVDATWLHQLLENKVAISQEKRAKIIWTLFSLELWYQKSYSLGA